VSSATLVTVKVMTGFAVGDLVLLTPPPLAETGTGGFQHGDLFKIATINGGASPAAGPGVLSFGTLSANAVHAGG
jgi:hypothetical protein